MQIMSKKMLIFCKYDNVMQNVKEHGKNKMASVFKKKN